MPKVKQSEEDLAAHLREQIGFLETSAASYDSGNESEAKRMAVHLRTLLHDTIKKDGRPNSQSLLGLLGIKAKTQFVDTSSEEGNMGSYSGLVMQSVGPGGGSFIAPLDDLPPDQKGRTLPFDEYWNKKVLLDTKKRSFTRSEIVLALANKDGGAHIDPELEEDYADLTKSNSLGWLYGNDLEWAPLQNPVSSTVRQISHEILKTLILNYPEKKPSNKHGGIVIGGIRLIEGFSAGKLIQMPKRKKKVSMSREDKKNKCSCGSGRKYRYCHGKQVTQ